MKWVVSRKDLEEYKRARLDRSSEKQIRAYYGGLRPRKDLSGCNLSAIMGGPMFDDEMKDLEQIYRKKLADLNKAIADLTPSFLWEMKQYTDVLEEKSQLIEKLDVLLAKRENSHE